MKTIACLILSFIISGCALAQPEITGAQWNVTLKVVDENGQPVVGATASVGYIGKPLPGQVIEDARDLSKEISGLTDQNGLFTASHSDTSLSLGFDVQKAGYYPTHIAYTLFMPGQFGSDAVSKNRNPTITIVLKKIGNPIPMFAKWLITEPPAFKKAGRPPVSFNKSIGYDLIVGDWVAPYGKGQTTDIIFTEEFSKQSLTDFYYKLTISFPNTSDGIQEYKVPDAEEGSGLRSPYEAPVDGYRSQLTKENYHHPGQAGKPYEFDENKIYFFRVTRSGESGPHYGKIYGDFMRFTYYLNPMPDNRNVEFDPKHNLMKLGHRELNVTAP
jgi:hypothetical protein